MLKRLTSVILILILTIMFTFIPCQEVNAFLGTAVVIGGVTVSTNALAIGTATLVAGGLTFATNEHARTATIDFFRSVGSDVVQVFNDIQLVGDTVASVSNLMWDSAKNWIANKFEYGLNSLTAGKMLSKDDVIYTFMPTDFHPSEGISTTSAFDSLGNLITCKMIYKEGIFNEVWYYKNGVYWFDSTKANLDSVVPVYLWNTFENSKLNIKYAFVNTLGEWDFGTVISETFNNTTALDPNYDVSADLNIKDTDRDFVDNPSNRGVTVDVLGNYAGVASQDVCIDYDFGATPIDPEAPPIDVSGIIGKLGVLGDTISTGVNTLVGSISAGVGSLSTGITDIYDNLQALPATISTVISDFFTVNDLDFSGMRNLVVFDKFPFSIPFDFIDSVKIFAQSAKEPVFEIDIDTEFLTLNHTVDLSPYNFYISFFRYFVVIVFTIGLIFATSKFVQW